MSKTQAKAEKISLYQPDKSGLVFPEIPNFESFVEELEYRK